MFEKNSCRKTFCFIRNIILENPLGFLKISCRKFIYSIGSIIFIWKGQYITHNNQDLTLCRIIIPVPKWHPLKMQFRNNLYIYIPNNRPILFLVCINTCSAIYNIVNDIERPRVMSSPVRPSVRHHLAVLNLVQSDSYFSSRVHSFHSITECELTMNQVSVG